MSTENLGDCGNSIVSLDDIINGPSCGTDISFLAQVLSNPDCSTDVEDLDDITGLMGYYPPHGKHICELEDAQTPKKNDYFLLTQGKSSDLSSSKCRYGIFESQLFKDVLAGINVKTMAWQDKHDYSLTSHNHDALYSKVIWIPNSLYQGSGNVELGKIKITTGRNASTAVTAKIQVPIINSPLPPEPLIGTFKFVSAKAWAKMQSENGYAKGNLDTTAHVESYIYSGNNVKDTFDGWVFANGVEITNKNGAFNKAVSVFGESSAGKFKVPNFQDFFKANPKQVTSFRNGTDFKENAPTAGMKAHFHACTDLKISGSIAVDTAQTVIPSNNDWKDTAPTKSSPIKGIHYGKNAGTGVTVADATADVILKANNLQIPSTTLSDSGTATASLSRSNYPYPSHNIIPVMVYIGGVTAKYFEDP